jgi:diguanylate cyclase (GGDEF)-like protein
VSPLRLTPLSSVDEAAMLQMDMLSAYAICGAGALAGAAMVRLADSGEPRVRRAVNVCTLALLLFGLAMGSAIFADRDVASSQQYFMTACCLVSVLLFNFGLRLLCGETPGHPAHHAALAGGVMALGSLLPALGVLSLVWGFAAGLAVSTTVAAYSSRAFVLRPRSHPERALGLAVLTMALTSLVRMVFTHLMPGPPEPHLLHVPPALWSAFALVYGVLPIVFATLLLTLVNVRLQQQLQVRASTDELTGAMTRRAMREVAPGLIEGHRDADGALALLMMDLDHFKNINDQFGHASGDIVLKSCGELLQQQLRPGALLARYGGEEFVALVPVADLPAARSVAERLRAAVATTACRAKDGRKIDVTLSVGVACVGPQETLDAALQRADDALYRAKRGGRDQVQVGLEAA